MALLKTLINKFGKMAGWNSVSTTMLGRTIEGITQLAYNDSQETENAYGRGGKPIGRAVGNYAATASITLYKEEVIALQLAIGPGNNIMDIEPFDISVLYEYQGMIYKDVIRNCQFTNNGVDVKQNDKTIATQYTLLPSHVDWGLPV